MEASEQSKKWKKFSVRIDPKEFEDLEKIGEGNAIPPAILARIAVREFIEKRREQAANKQTT